MRHKETGTVVLAETATSGTYLTAGTTYCAGVILKDIGDTVAWEECGYLPMRGKVTIEFDMEDGQ